MFFENKLFVKYFGRQLTHPISIKLENVQILDLGKYSHHPYLRNNYQYLERSPKPAKKKRKSPNS